MARLRTRRSAIATLTGTCGPFLVTCFLVIGTIAQSIVAQSIVAQSIMAQSTPKNRTASTETAKSVSDGPFVVLLGIAQDSGYPQAGCRKACCARAWADPAKRRHVASIAIVDPQSKQRWLLDCTPDLREQLHELDRVAPPGNSPSNSPSNSSGIDGIFLSHAHVGHYTGLMQFGREVMGTRQVRVFAMPRMRQFLERNGPWSQLVTAGNISIHDLADRAVVKLNQRLKVTPLLVPHRDEYSETVGFRVDGPSRSVLFLPDIDKWNRWSTRIEDVLREVDVAYVDGTFFTADELPGRDMSAIPHPFIVESMARFRGLPKAERNKLRFLHFNHTNPALDPDSRAAQSIRAAGHHVAVEGERVEL